MAHKSTPVFRRNPSISSSGFAGSIVSSVVDPHDRAEQGLYEGTVALTSPELNGQQFEPKKPPLSRYSHSSSSILAGSTGEVPCGELETGLKHLPQQG
jgi:hypothetical protein